MLAIRLTKVIPALVVGLILLCASPSGVAQEGSAQNVSVCERLDEFTPRDEAKRISPHILIAIPEDGGIVVGLWHREVHDDVLIWRVAADDLDGLRASLNEAGLAPDIPVFILPDKNAKTIGLTFTLAAMYMEWHECYSILLDHDLEKSSLADMSGA